MENIEIEIRIKLLDPTLLMDWFKKTAKLLRKTEQEDFYFELPKQPFIFVDEDGYKDANEWLRVRKSSNGNSFCYKKWHRDPKNKVSLYADEFETSLENYKKAIMIFEALGFRAVSVIKKQREDYQYKDFLFSCDVVEGLGSFVEIEFNGIVEDLGAGRKKILSLLESIGLRENDYQIVKRGYPWMQWNKNKELFEN
ncbi:class IV adenylate cyclase [Candidatus Parcubacteria bacterium]|nr:class IV adenylate cyclase [Candidatus Parcubacteria bacterium]